MIAPKDPPATDTPDGQKAPVALVDIGNATTDVGLWKDDAVTGRRALATDPTEKIGAALKAFAADAPDGYLAAVAIASVVPQALTRLCLWVEDHLNLEPLIVGRQVPLPIHVRLDAPEAVGVDRVCAAAAAFDKNHQACVVVDCGTAVTVDVVDDDGAFIGGAIFPGLWMQARALHEYTAALPRVAPAKPAETIGADTEGAIRTGLFHGTAGAVRGIIEAYATHFKRWPIVIATGGDAALIAEECDIFDAVVTDLCLRGVGLAYNQRLRQAVTL